MNAVTQIALPVVSEATAIINLIERAARDPAVDIDKLARLLELRKTTEDRVAERAFGAAMSAAQAEMRAVAADANNPQTRSKYASYFAMDKALRPIYTAHGFALTFDTTTGAAENSVRVTCDVLHAEGHRRRYQVDMPNDGKGARGGEVMTRTHATGAALTYGQRYLLRMIWNCAIGQDDDQGSDSTGTNAASEYISAKQVAEIKTLIESTGGNVEKFCAFAKVPALDNIYAARFEAACEAVRRAGEQRAKVAAANAAAEKKDEYPDMPAVLRRTK
jgi:hypothetical protein